MSLSLPKRLRTNPTFQPGYVYHVTQGVHLRGIQRKGLSALNKNRQSPKKNLFTHNMGKAFKVHGTDVVYGLHPFTKIPGLEKFATRYFQGIAVLRCMPARLSELGYKYDHTLSLAGDLAIEASDIDLFIDGHWWPLDRVLLWPNVWSLIFSLTGFLRAHR